MDGGGSQPLGAVIRRRLVNADFARLWAGQAVSTVGDFVFDTTLTIWVATRLLAHSQWAPAAVSGLMLCALAAVIVVGPLAGVFVDRWDRRRTMLASEVVRAALVAALALVLLLPTSALPVGVWLGIVYAVVLVLNAAGQFFNPSRFSLVADLVPDPVDRARAFGLSQATASTAAIVGPPLAAPLMIAAGVEWALVVNALSYVVSFVAVRAIRVPVTTGDRAPSGSRRWSRDFVDGLRAFAHNRFLVALLTVAVICSLGTGALTPLMLFFLNDNLHVAGRWLGVVDMALGLGSVAGSLLSGWAARRLGTRRLVWSSVLLAGALIVIFARQTNLAAALVVMFVAGIPVAALNVGLNPLLLAVTPKEYLGRVIAVFTPVNTAAAALSLVVAGTAASTALHSFHATVAGLHIGGIDVVYTMSGLLIVLAGIYAVAALPDVGTSGATPEAEAALAGGGAAGASTAAGTSGEAAAATLAP